MAHQQSALSSISRNTRDKRRQEGLGHWDNGVFRFSSPEAEEACTRQAYKQAVHDEKWHLGDELDDKTRDLVLAGIAGPTKPIFQGPDRKYRFANANTIENELVRNHRSKHFAGKTMAQILGAEVSPGENELVEARRASRLPAANDNQSNAFRPATLRSNHTCATCTKKETADHDARVEWAKQPAGGNALLLAQGSIEDSPTGLWDWLFKGPRSPDAPEPTSCPEPDCDKIHKLCHDECVYLYTGRGFNSDAPQLYRKCVRECMHAAGCFNY